MRHWRSSEVVFRSGLKRKEVLKSECISVCCKITGSDRNNQSKMRIKMPAVRIAQGKSTLCNLIFFTHTFHNYFCDNWPCFKTMQMYTIPHLFKNQVFSYHWVSLFSVWMSFNWQQTFFCTLFKVRQKALISQKIKIILLIFM